MVLCPFVYLQIRHDLPPLALQPSEVHSAHWVPLMGILSPSLRRDVRCDVSERFTKHRRPVLSVVLRAIVGQLVFAAVKLKPTESLYSNSIPESVLEDQVSTLWSTAKAYVLGQSWPDADDQPLLLWGLTLGIMADLLEIMDRPATSKLWSWPTFSPWDIRTMIWLLNCRFQSQKIRELTRAESLNDTESHSTEIGGLDNTTYSTSVKRRVRGSEAGVSGMMLLEDYSDRLRRAVIVGLCLRFIFGASLTAFIVRKYRHRSTKLFSDYLSLLNIK